MGGACTGGVAAVAAVAAAALAVVRRRIRKQRITDSEKDVSFPDDSAAKRTGCPSMEGVTRDGKMSGGSFGMVQVCACCIQSDCSFICVLRYVHM